MKDPFPEQKAAPKLSQFIKGPGDDEPVNW